MTSAKPNARKPRGTLALLGGGEFTEACAPLDRDLLAAAGTDEVLVLPTAAAFEHPQRVVDRAVAHFAGLGVRAVGVMITNRREADDEANHEVFRTAKAVYLADGSPLHLRSVLKDSGLLRVLLGVYQRGGLLAASGAGATLLADPMVDPRGGAYTVGLGVVQGLAVFPYHGSAADHLRDRSIELLPPTATLAGIDEHTALVRDPEGSWRVAGEGVVTLYRRDQEPVEVGAGPVPQLTM